MCSWNCDGVGQGKLAVLSTMLDDVEGGTPHIVALEETWGLVPATALPGYTIRKDWQSFKETRRKGQAIALCLQPETKVLGMEKSKHFVSAAV